jgi:hypothetical protein
LTEMLEEDRHRKKEAGVNGRKEIARWKRETERRRKGNGEAKRWKK